MSRFEIVRTDAGWHARFRAGNGQTVWTTETYTRRRAATNAVTVLGNRVQVGWYCDHEDEAYSEGSHMATHGRWKRQKWQETYAQPSTRKSLSFLHHREPEKKPPCPRAVPIYVIRDAADTLDVDERGAS